jgi:hypothetical protein
MNFDRLSNDDAMANGAAGLVQSIAKDGQEDDRCNDTLKAKKYWTLFMSVKSADIWIGLVYLGVWDAEKG